jgi:hypothetical protein
MPDTQKFRCFNCGQEKQLAQAASLSWPTRLGWLVGFLWWSFQWCVPRLQARRDIHGFRCGDFLCHCGWFGDRICPGWNVQLTVLAIS